jgi:wyosine [tRNA(Phe)-imidazoG37] synthetase (radical SAM superfamily)
MGKEQITKEDVEQWLKKMPKFQEYKKSDLFLQTLVDKDVNVQKKKIKTKNILILTLSIISIFVYKLLIHRKE